MNFEGFVPPTKNYFPMPNEWIDICAEIRDISELKVIQYVIRHTWGFHEYGICKTISVDEFMQGRRRQDGTRMDKGTGLSEQSVRNGLKKAINDGYLLCDTDPSDAGRIKKSYALKMRSDGQVQTLDPPQTLDPVPGTNFRPQGTKPYTSDSQSLDPRVPEFIPRTEKDTIERHLEKNTLERQESSAPTSLSENDSHSHDGYTNQKGQADAHLLANTSVHPRDGRRGGSSNGSRSTLSVNEAEPAITLPARAEPLKFAEQVQQIITRRQTDPALPVVKPSKQKPIDPSSSAAAVQSPSATGLSSSSTVAPQAVSGKRTQAVQQVPKCSTKEIQARINAYRGYALEEEVEIIRERKAIKTWCNLHEIADYDLVLHYLTTLDPYWSKPENKYRIGGLTLLKETSKALAEMARKQNGKQEGPPDGPELGDCGYPKLHPRKPVYPDPNKQEPRKGQRYA